MRRVMSTLVAVGLLPVSAPSLAAYVTVEAYGSGVYTDWSVTFNNANDDTLLTVSELVPGSFTGMTNNVQSQSYPVLAALARVTDRLDGYDIEEGAIVADPFCTGFNWCFRTDGDPVRHELIADTGWLYRTSVSAVPLPAAAWLMLSGLGGLGFLGRRRKAA